MDKAPSEPFKEMQNPESRDFNAEKPRLLELAESIENADNEDEKRESINKFLDVFSETFHVKFSSDVTSLYRAMEDEGLLVRLEALSLVMGDLLEHKPIHLGRKGEGKYANVVIPKNEGIKIAFSEGLAPGPVRLIVGFDVRSAIGFDPQGLEVSDIDVSEFDPRDVNLRAAVCRHVEGDLPPENIKYLILRLPSHLVDEHHLLDKEIENAPEFIFRGARFSNPDARPN